MKRCVSLDNLNVNFIIVSGDLVPLKVMFSISLLPSPQIQGKEVVTKRRVLSNKVEREYEAKEFGLYALVFLNDDRLVAVGR